MNIQVVIVQMNSVPYLKPVLATARKFNSRVVLIGNEQAGEASEPAEFVRFEPLAQEAAYFQQIYQHLSTNPYGFELFCFQRWFVLQEYLESQRLDLCFAMDSDVLLYADAGAEFREAFDHDYAFTLVQGTIGCSSYFTRGGLADFCRFVRETYENKTAPRFAYLLNTAAEFQKSRRAGGICDMTLFRLYALESKARIGEMCSVIDGSTCDHNINVSDGYETAGAVKKIYPRGGRPYCKSLDHGGLIRFKTLHFQGEAKKWLAEKAEEIARSVKS